MARKTEQLTVGRRRITVSGLDKILYPGKKFTKARVIDYYVSIAKYLLPHMKDRPVTLKRFPEGVYGEAFWEKDAPAFTPSWVNTVSVARRETPGPPIRYLLINDLPALVWAASLDTLEIHPFLHRARQLDRPTAIVFDCDPGEGADLLACARVALMLRAVLQELGFESYVKVSGSKGLQVYLPLNSAVTYEQTEPLAKGIAQLLAQREPKLIVAEMPKRLRTKKVFIDWSQNTDFKTTVGVYSLRAKIYRPYVSVPIDWDELSDVLQSKDTESLFFTPEETLERVEKLGDLFKPMLTKVQTLPMEVCRYFEQQQRSHSSKRSETLATYEAKRDFKKTAGAKARCARTQPSGQPPSLCNSETRRESFALRLSSRDARRAEVVVSAQRSAIQKRRTPTCDAD